MFRQISNSEGGRVAIAMGIEYGIPKSIPEVCAISEIHDVGKSIHAMSYSERNPTDTEYSVDKVHPSGCDNPDLGGKPNLQEEKSKLNAEDELSAAANGLAQTPVRCVAQYGLFFLKWWNYILGRWVVFGCR